MHKKKAGKLQTGSTIPKQYWLAVNGKPKTVLATYDQNVLQSVGERITNIEDLEPCNHEDDSPCITCF